jgi:serine/threonine-protein phosphatase 2A regulatory subunit B'
LIKYWHRERERENEKLLAKRAGQKSFFFDTKHKKMEETLIKKLRQCTVKYDFSDPVADLKNKELKRTALNELIEQLNAPKGCLTEATYPELITMISTNIFRKLPTPSEKKINEIDQEEDEPNFDPSWPHLQLVYEVFLKVLESSEFQTNIAKKFIDQRFVANVTLLFFVLSNKLFGIFPE